MALWNLKNKKVLIVEDHQEMRAILQSIVEPLIPEEIVTAKNGEEAIERLEEQQFDIVFCDYNLGNGRDGQQVLEEAKYREFLPFNAIFVMCTAENTSEMVMGAIDYLPDDYISKPFNRTVIHSRLKKLLDRKNNLTDISLSMADKDYRKALSQCDALLKTKPANRSDLLKTKGELLITLGEFDQAVDMYEDIIEERDIPWAYMGLGKTYFFQKEYEEALQVFSGLIKSNPSNVAAYDWMAKIHEAMGELDKAQQMLAIGASKSPKSLVRQRHLAQVAHKNNDLETATSSYQKAINVGQHSCYKATDDYNALAKTLVENNKGNEALQVVAKIEKDFKNTPQAKMAAALTEGMIHSSSGNEEAAGKCLQQALDSYAKDAQGLSSSLALELTDLCLATGNEEAANEVAQNLVRNNHDNQDIIAKTKQVFADAGKAEAGDSLVDTTKKEIIDLNNSGARLLKEGKLEESSELFMKAARGMPDNVIVNLNAAYSLLQLMKKTGKVKKYSTRVGDYLERVRTLDPANKKYHDLMASLKQATLASKAA